MKAFKRLTTPNGRKGWWYTTQIFTVVLTRTLEDGAYIQFGQFIESKV